MRMYGMVSIGGGGLLGLAAIILSLVWPGGGRSTALPICLALSSVALFIGGTIFYVASCCQAQAPKAAKSK